MSKKLHKSLRIYFSKLMKIRTMSLPSPPTTSSLLSACKYPKTSSFARGGHRSDVAHAATLSDVDRFLFENFQSLYIRDDHDDDVESSRPSPDAIKPSGRFFASLSTSNSLVGDARTSSSASSPAIDPDSRVPGESVAVVTFSKEPYDDFRRSMQEMVDARHVHHRGQPLDWDFMGELLFCYLELNDRTVHKHILMAFADLAVSFRRRIPPGRPTTRRRRKKQCVLVDDWNSILKCALALASARCTYGLVLEKILSIGFLSDASMSTAQTTESQITFLKNLGCPSG